MNSGFFCSQCGSFVKDKNLLYFNDDKKDFGICSEKCYSTWQNMMAEKKELCLKDISVRNWDKVRILVPWEEVEKWEGGVKILKETSLIKKINFAQKLVKKGEKVEVTGQYYFTQESLEKIKRFVNLDYEFCTGMAGSSTTENKKLSSLSVNDNIFWYKNGDSLKRDYLTLALMYGGGRSQRTIIEGNKFINREAFEFMAWALGDQKIECYYFDLDEEMQKVEKEFDAKFKTVEQQWKDENQRAERSYSTTGLESEAQKIIKELRDKNQKISTEYLQKEKRAGEEHDEKIQGILSSYQKGEAEITKKSKEIEEGLRTQRILREEKNKEIVDLMEEMAKGPNLGEEEKKLKEELIEATKNIKIDEEVNNILLIGSTGNGKSTLGNVIVDQEGYFKESELAASETKDYKIGKFEVDLGWRKKNWIPNYRYYWHWRYYINSGCCPL